MNIKRRHPAEIKKKTRVLRSKGWTHREIGKELDIAFTTVFYWTKGINLTAEQKKAIERRRNRYSPNFGIEERRALARRNLASFWKPTPSNKKLIQRIINFYKEQGRTPFKREFNNTYKEYRKRFGSWNNAIKLAGFEPNPVIFSKKFTAKDGHICDSYAEKIIDDWLFKYKVNHEKNLPYQNTKMTADFAVGNVRIEYFGLSGEDRLYDEIIKRKRRFCQKNDLKLIEIYPSNLFPNCLSKTINLEKLRE
jgi:hypothetical protein